MKKQIDLVKEFHEKFRALVSDNPSLIPKDRSDNRYRLMKDEVEEVHRSNMSKDYHEYKMVKGSNYFKTNKAYRK